MSQIPTDQSGEGHPKQPRNKTEPRLSRDPPPAFSPPCFLVGALQPTTVFGMVDQCSTTVGHHSGQSYTEKGPAQTLPCPCAPKRGGGGGGQRKSVKGAVAALPPRVCGMHWCTYVCRRKEKVMRQLVLHLFCGVLHGGQYWPRAGWHRLCVQLSIYLYPHKPKLFQTADCVVWLVWVVCVVFVPNRRQARPKE